MTGITAEKHDAFLEPDKSGNVIMKFSEKSLIRGESDASSFPSGGLRATFEARGYTAWDPTSYAFVKDGSLYIPTAFCSYSGEALDKKTPLLRSMQAINTESLKVLSLFNNKKCKKVTPMVGAEQEYFLIDKSVYEKRLDLIHCGRTLFGARPSKGQELEDHYYGAIKSKVLDFMKEVNEELWKLGVYAKTEHNEVAPSQHELACFYTSANIASDQNQLCMEVLKSVANRHGLVCILSEKPFESVSGSGKHNNWSLMTDSGENLFDPGDTPESNAQFLVFLCSVICAVDDYQDLLRISVASAGNDLRLGSNEAPPSVISMYIGEDLEKILYAVDKGEIYNPKKKSDLKTGVSFITSLPKDSTDRNRTSPFAFTGNKFEFRMVGSSFNISCPNFIINTIVSEELSKFYDIIKGAKSLNEGVVEVIKYTVKNHKRILFSGNSYSKEWKLEAKARGLYDLKTTALALVKYDDKKNIDVMEKHKVLTKDEIVSRKEILLDNYANIVHIEALTAIDMANKQIAPNVLAYEKVLLKGLNMKKKFDETLPRSLEENVLRKISSLSEKFYLALEKLTNDVKKFEKYKSALDKARFSEKVLLKDLSVLRKNADEMELIMGDEYKPFPNYGDILYSVKY